MTPPAIILGLAGSARKKGRRPSERLLRAEWFAVERTKTASLRTVRKTLRDIFSEMEAEALSRLVEVLGDAAGKALLAGGENARHKADVIGEALLDVEAWADELSDRLGPLFRAQAEEGFKSGLARVGVGGIDFTSDNPIVARVLFESTSKIRGVSETTADILGRRLQRALTDGADLNELQRVVASTFTEARSWRTRMIARTSGGAGFEAGQTAAYGEAGVPFKIWLTERDDKVREGTIYNHAIMDGEKARVNEPFLVPPGEFMMHPLDPAGSAGNVINCRCTTRPEIDDDKDFVPFRRITLLTLNKRIKRRAA